MLDFKSFTRSLAFAGTVTLLLGSSAFAQTSQVYGRNGNRTDMNRIVEGTVSSVVHERNGDRVRMTNGMNLLVPTSITGVRQGRRYGASTLRAGDVVRLGVYSREGDGRDAEVRSIELVQGNSNYRTNEREVYGTVVSVDRRNRTLLMQADNGRSVTVDMNAYSGRGNRFRRGDRIVVSGRANRGGGFVASDVRVDNNVEPYDRRQ